MINLKNKQLGFLLNPWRFVSGGGEIGGNDFLLIGHDGGTNNTVYSWDDVTGFGQAATDLSTTATSFYRAAFSNLGNFIAIGGASLPYIYVSRFDGSTISARYSSISPTLPASVRGVSFSKNENAIAVVNTYYRAYAWSLSGFGSQYSDPASPPSGTAYGVNFSGDGNYVSIITSTTPYIYVYPWNDSTGFGTKFSDPTSVMTTTATSWTEWSPDGNVIAMAGSISPRIAAWEWSTSGFGTRYSNPVTTVQNTSRQCSWHPSGNAIAVDAASTAGGRVYAWDNSTGFGTAYASFSPVLPGISQGVSFSISGDSIVNAHVASPYVTGRSWSLSTGYGSKFSDPVTLPAGNGRFVQFARRQS